MSIGNRMRGLGESVYYLDDLKPKMDELMGDVSYELNHEVGKRKLLVRLDGFGEEYKPQIETLMDEELPVGYRMEYDPFPLDFIKINFLESTGTQTIDTQQRILYSWHVVCDVAVVKRTYFHQIWGWRDGYGNKESLGYWVLPPTTSDSMSFMYDFQEKRVYKKPETAGRILINYIGSEAKVYIGADSLTFTKKDDYETTLTSGLFAGHRINGVNDYSPTFCRIFNFMAEDGSGVKRINYVPALNSTGIPCMYDLVTKQPFYNQGTGQFIAGLTMKQALNLAKLPTPSGNNKLTISLPKEATLVQHNQEVEAALNMAAEKGWNIPVQYREAGEEKEIINKYAECKTVDDMLAVNADYKNDLTDEGEWIYPLTNVKRFTNVGDWWNGFFSNSSIKKIKAVFPNTVYAQALFSSADKLEEIDVEFPIATQISGFIRNNVVLKKLRIVAPFVTNSEYSFQWTYAKNPDIYIYFPMANRLDAMFANSPYFQEIKGEFGANATNCNSTYYKCNSLRICPSYYPKATTASDMFYGCQITAEVAINVLESFPKYTSGDHPVTMGIHIDHKDDIEVAEAIENAEAKGWTVTVQWNGTPTAQTASTFSLRKQPIYAKLGTMELSDGTTEQYLDWGHYVTNWEENGYQEFASIEEAEKHFNIKKEITE